MYPNRDGWGRRTLRHRLQHRLLVRGRPRSA